MKKVKKITMKSLMGVSPKKFAQDKGEAGSFELARVFGVVSEQSDHDTQYGEYRKNKGNFQAFLAGKPDDIVSSPVLIVPEICQEIIDAHFGKEQPAQFALIVGMNVTERVEDGKPTFQATFWSESLMPEPDPMMDQLAALALGGAEPTGKKDSKKK